jgi:hypothetical protein
MSRKTPLFLESKEFQSKKEALDFFKDMKERYKNKIIDNIEDKNNLIFLLQRHPEKEEKIGVGIKDFKVAKSDIYKENNYCFYIIRTDDSETDFSYKTCIDSKHLSKRELVLSAFRYTVRPYIKSLKEKIGEKREAKYKKPNVFIKIVEKFLEDKKINFDDIEITDAQDNEYVPELICEEMKESFIDYHSKTAEIIFV